MRITEALAVLVGEYPKYSKTKLSAALKAEMRRGAGVDAETALPVVREVIASGLLVNNAQLGHADPTGNEAVARLDRTPSTTDFYYGISATGGRKISPRVAEADEQAKRDAAPIRELLGLS